MEVVDGFGDRTKNIQSVTNKLFLKVFPVGFRGIEDVRAEGAEATEGTRQSTLSSVDSRADLA